MWDVEFKYGTAGRSWTAAGVRLTREEAIAFAQRQMASQSIRDFRLVPV